MKWRRRVGLLLSAATASAALLSSACSEATSGVDEAMAAAPGEPAGARASSASADAAARPVETDTQELFDLWDENKDGVVEGAEYDRRGGGPSHYDLDKDETLTAVELQAYYDRDATAPTGSAAGASGGAATPGALPGSLPVGKYSCLHIYYDFLNKRTMQDQLGTLTILPGGRYHWFEGAAGNFEYASSGQVQWTSGAFATMGAKESGVEWKGDDLMLKITFPAEKRDLTYRCYLQT